MYMYMYMYLIECGVLSLDIASSRDNSFHCTHTKVVVILNKQKYYYRNFAYQWILHLCKFIYSDVSSAIQVY